MENGPIQGGQTNEQGKIVLLNLWTFGRLSFAVPSFIRFEGKSDLKVSPCDIHVCLIVLGNGH